jgi:hypothetical protein
MKKCYLLFIGALLCTIGVYAQTNISSNFDANATLTVANSPYIVTNYVTINPGITVTVETGVEIRFNSGTELRVYGTLNAKSTKFTANGSTSKGFWNGIAVSYQWSPEIGNVTLDNCTVEYARSIWLDKGVLTLKNSTLNNFSEYGVVIFT